MIKFENNSAILIAFTEKWGHEGPWNKILVFWINDRILILIAKWIYEAMGLIIIDLFIYINIVWF